MFIPGVKVADTEDVKNIDFSMVFFCVACLSIGNVSNHLGIGNMVANLLIPILQPLSSTVVVGAIYVIGLILNFLLTPFAILGGFSEPIAQVALAWASTLSAHCTVYMLVLTRYSCLMNI